MSDQVCPECGSAVTWYPECPRYSNAQGTGFMCCFPACGNADGWKCVRDACDWDFIDGLNSKLSYFEANEARRPAWLERRG